MDVVWLKKDVRLHDHAGFAAVAASNRPFCVVFMYEPDQIAHHSVHGSHVNFANEGLVDLDARIHKMLLGNEGETEQELVRSGLSCITVMQGEATAVLSSIDKQTRISQVLAHEETGHGASFERDKRVRKWCREHEVKLVEFPQTGVTRGLRDRDLFTRRYNALINLPQHPTPSPDVFRSRLVRNLPSCGIQHPSDLPLSCPEHAIDRVERQRGGETEALAILDAFLTSRGEGYSRGISSPSSSWSSCSRLSPFLAFGHLSVRTVSQRVAEKQRALRAEKQAKKLMRTDNDWLRSLSAFHSRIRWRAHFMQKLESEPAIEFHAQCRAYDTLRCGEGDWNHAHYKAWAEGRTGFPMVDACMRCLIRHGWVNFRMRAMLVSFACWNLWLDWRGIASHLARVFLDYEPGIHYPQLQMQAGATGINAMRVYSATKQGRDHDKDGAFVRNYVPELSGVHTSFIHEPARMSLDAQIAAGVIIDTGEECVDAVCAALQLMRYPAPIVDEAATAKEAKRRVAAVKRMSSTREAAAEVMHRHGSRRTRRGEARGREKGTGRAGVRESHGVQIGMGMERVGPEGAKGDRAMRYASGEEDVEEKERRGGGCGEYQATSEDEEAEEEGQEGGECTGRVYAESAAGDDQGGEEQARKRGREPSLRSEGGRASKRSRQLSILEMLGADAAQRAAN